MLYVFHSVYMDYMNSALLLQRQTNKVSLTYFILMMVTAQGTSSQIPVYKDEMRSHLSQENIAAQN